MGNSRVYFSANYGQWTVNNPCLRKLQILITWLLLKTYLVFLLRPDKSQFYSSSFHGSLKVFVTHIGQSKIRNDVYLHAKELLGLVLKRSNTKSGRVVLHFNEKSTSLVSSLSSRAVDPTTKIFLIPFRDAIWYSLSLTFRMSSIFMGPHNGITPIGASSDLAPLKAECIAISQ